MLLIYPALHRTVGRKKTCPAYALPLERLHGKLYHVKERYADAGLHRIVKAVRRVARHDKHLSTRLLKKPCTALKLLDGAFAAGEQRSGAVWDVGV